MSLRHFTHSSSPSFSFPSLLSTHFTFFIFLYTSLFFSLQPPLFIFTSTTTSIQFWSYHQSSMAKMNPLFILAFFFSISSLFFSTVRSDSSDKRYKEGDLVPLFANKVGPFHNPRYFFDPLFTCWICFCFIIKVLNYL